MPDGARSVAPGLALLLPEHWKALLRHTLNDDYGLMDALTFIAKGIGTTARVGGAFALAAGFLYMLRRLSVDPSICPSTLHGH
jgi:hypothetical protein